ncbi:MAG: helicase-associated domain-containing protein [Chloroflexota bacterium]
MCTTHNIAGFERGVSTNSRTRAIDLLRKQLGKPEVVRTALQQMGVVEAFAIKKLISSGGMLKTNELRAAIQEAGIPLKVSPSDISLITPDYAGVPRFEDAIARATAFGLIFSRETTEGQKELRWIPGRTLFVPDPVRHVLLMTRDLRETLETMSQKMLNIPSQQVEPSRIMHGAASDFQRDLSRYWRHVRKIGRLSVTTQGWIYKNAFKQVLAALNSPPDAPVEEASNWRLWFIRRLLMRMGDIVPADRYINDLGTSTKPKLPQLTMADRIRQCFELWRDEKVWSEFVELINAAPEQESMLNTSPELNKARATLLRAIARLSTSQPTRWVSIEELCTSIKRTDYDWLFPRNYRGRNLKKGSSLYQSPYYYENNPYRISFQNVPNEEKGWEMVEVGMIALTLCDPLHWLGLVDLGYEPKQAGQPDMPLAYRLTDVGAWLLGIAPQPVFVESGGRVITQPNFTILAMEPIPDAVILELDLFADAKGGDRVLNYELNRQSVYRAQIKGKTVNDIIQFLEQHQGGPIANNVRRTLEEWETQHRRIVFHQNARLIQFADTTAKEATQSTIEASLKDAQDAPTIVSLSPDFILTKGRAPTQTLVTRLSESGWIPFTSTSTNTDTAGSIRLEENGEFEFRQPTPSIYTLALTDKFATRTKQGGKITPDGVRAAMSKGVKLNDLLTQLKNLHNEALTAKLETNIRSWAGFYGKASLKTVCLLELSNREVLDNLLKDRILGKYLQPIEGSSKPMALVDTAYVAQVEAVLRERGVAL